jgi:AcrR family transcriptional regulator
VSWAERVADRSPTVQRSRERSIEQSRQIVGAARRLIERRGGQWTTKELASEAEVALQTFYRHFDGKDQLLLAVIEDLMAESVAGYELVARRIKDPVDRLHRYVSIVFESVTDEGRPGAQYITAQHWRLHQVVPAELATAIKPFTDLLANEIRGAQAAGRLPAADADVIARAMTRLVMVEYHYYVFVPPAEGMREVADRVWKFCLSGLGAAELPATVRSGRRSQ